MRDLLWDPPAAAPITYGWKRERSPNGRTREAMVGIQMTLTAIYRKQAALTAAIEAPLGAMEALLLV